MKGYFSAFKHSIFDLMRMRQLPFPFQIIALLLLLFGGQISLKADHYYGGYFHYRHIGDRQLEVTLVTYTDDYNDISDRDSVLFNWGDGNRTYAVRDTAGGDSLYYGMRKNTYIGTHTYAKYANFQSYFSDNYRLYDVSNMEIGKSGVTNLRFDGIAPVQDSSVECVNNSPVPHIDPFFYGQSGQEFELNFGYSDEDGDSLVFELGECKQANGSAADGYELPNGVDIDPTTGQFTWNNPGEGKYCFTIILSEFRKGFLVGKSAVDFTLFIDHIDFHALETGSLIGTASTSFSSSTSEKFIVKYAHPTADSLICAVVNPLNDFGISVTENKLEKSGEFLDTLTIAYDGTGAYFSTQSVLVECKAFWGRDSVLSEVKPFPISLSNKPEVNCSNPELDKVEDIAPEIPSLSIAPNLFDDHVWINLGTGYENASIYIFDTRGRLVRLYDQITGQTIKLDLANLSSAMYLIQVYADGEIIHFDKMVKK